MRCAIYTVAMLADLLVKMEPFWSSEFVCCCKPHETVQAFKQPHKCETMGALRCKLSFFYMLTIPQQHPLLLRPLSRAPELSEVLPLRFTHADGVAAANLHITAAARGALRKLDIL